MPLSRREFLKTTAAVSAATAIGIAVPEELLGVVKKTEAGWKWDKSVCRFCGTGCGIMVATKNDMIVAVKGDPAAPVNMGLNCIKGYFNAKIMYGADRLTQPLLDLERYNCMQCHVAQVDLPPPVKSTFRGEFRNKQGKSRSNLIDTLNEGVSAD
jgi:hypothetical protein